MPNTKVKALGLTNTAVTAGSYTSASITVDAQGRITAASSGSAGAGMAIPVLTATGPSSGTYTKNNAANRIGVYMWAGGGGNTPNFGCGGNPGTGGSGGMGFYNYPTTTPFSQPYSIGAAGNPGTQPGNGPTNSANAGGATTLTNVGTVNAGNGASGGPSQASLSPGNTGTAPGASYAYNIRTFIAGYNAGAAQTAGALIIFENTGT